MLLAWLVDLRGPAGSLPRPLRGINRRSPIIIADLSGARIVPMQTRIIDGNAIAGELREGLSKRTATLAARGVRAGLAVIRVGEHPASSVYVRNKIKACGDSGIHSQDIQLPDTADEATLLGQI